MADPLLLLVDTSGSSCGAALARGEKLLGEAILSHGMVRSSFLLSAVDLLLSEAGIALSAIDAFAVTVGPGSFTGLRVGMSTVKGMALSLGTPVVPLSSLELLAWNLPQSALPVCSMSDARKREVYAGLYDTRGGGRVLIGDSVASPRDFLARLDGEVLFVGDGAAAYHSEILDVLGSAAHFAPRWCDVPRPSSGISLAVRRLSRGETFSPELLVPVYIRPSEAELARNSGQL